MWKFPFLTLFILIPLPVEFSIQILSVKDNEIVYLPCHAVQLPPPSCSYICTVYIICICTYIFVYLYV